MHQHHTLINLPAARSLCHLHCRRTSRCESWCGSADILRSIWFSLVISTLQVCQSLTAQQNVTQSSVDTNNEVTVTCVVCRGRTWSWWACYLVINLKTNRKNGSKPCSVQVQGAGPGHGGGPLPDGHCVWQPPGHADRTHSPPYAAGGAKSRASGKASVADKSPMANGDRQTPKRRRTAAGKAAQKTLPGDHMGIVVVHGPAHDAGQAGSCASGGAPVGMHV